jgi:Cys-rich four helix bundle protein (predicted Tat secretion target)
MDRRSVLVGINALVLTALADSAAADEPEHHHDHHGGKHASLVAAAADCVQKGQACIAHCISLLGQGEKEMASCHASVHQTVAICAALQEIANLDSKYLGALAKVAMEICKGCEEECRKHENKHMVCKHCADACAACYKECKAASV